jgi:prevent-host-death family protein
MKTTTVRELRNNYAKVLKWVSAGEEVEVTRRGKAVAKVVPVALVNPTKVDWAESAALKGLPWATALTEAQSGSILAESQGS